MIHRTKTIATFRAKSRVVKIRLQSQESEQAHQRRDLSLTWRHLRRRTRHLAAWCLTKLDRLHSPLSSILDRIQSPSMTDWKSLFKMNHLWSPSSMKRTSTPIFWKHIWRSKVGALIKSLCNKPGQSRRTGREILLEWLLSHNFSLNLVRLARANKVPKERVRASRVMTRSTQN